MGRKHFQESTKAGNQHNTKENSSTIGLSLIYFSEGNNDSNKVDGSIRKSERNMDQGGGLPEKSKDTF